LGLTNNFEFDQKVLGAPGMRQLNPFFNIRDNFNIREGNPDLLPEFTDSYELTSIFDIGKSSLNFGVYHRFTTDVVENYTLVITDQK